MRRKSITAVLFCFILLQLFPTITVRAERTTNYTYTYDFWADNRESPDAYTANRLITGGDLGIGDFKDPQGMYVRGNLIYLCDTGNNRIVIMERKEYGISFVAEFGEFQGDGSVLTFSGPQDICVTENGDMYICDTGNQRVVHLTPDRRLVKELVRPLDETVDQASDFLPLKAVTDKSGRIIVLVKNYNKGFVEYTNNGEFSGFIGANEVKFNMADYLWKMIATKEQRAQMQQFVPTEYNNLSLDRDDFIYCTTATFDEWELRTDQAKPIRKLNAMGTDILIKNGVFPPIGDVWWGNAAGVSGASRLIDVTALDNDTYYAIDRMRGRIFGYDSQGNLLYAFGGLGNRLGYFQYPTALDHMGNDLLVLDSRASGITILTPTQYGQLIYDALEEYNKGNYEASAQYWEKVLMQNGNYDLAYIGIGRSLLRQGEYKEAMKYFKLKLDDDNYSKAFALYRKEWIEKNIGWIIAAVITCILLFFVTGVVKKMKREVEEA
jgi:tetratricopeptide (TPR) repeat protein